MSPGAEAAAAAARRLVAALRRPGAGRLRARGPRRQPGPRDRRGQPLGLARGPGSGPRRPVSRRPRRRPARSTGAIRPPTRSSSSPARPPTTIWLFDALIDVSYELDLFGRVRRSIEAAARRHRGGRRGPRRPQGHRRRRDRPRLRRSLRARRRARRRAPQPRGRQPRGRHHRRAPCRRRRLRVRGRARPDAGRPGPQRDPAAGGPAARRAAPADRAAGPHAGARADRGRGLRHRAEARGRRSRSATARRCCGAGPTCARPSAGWPRATARIGVATAELYPRITLTGFYGGAGSAALGADRRARPDLGRRPDHPVELPEPERPARPHPRGQGRRSAPRSPPSIRPCCRR